MRDEKTLNKKGLAFLFSPLVGVFVVLFTIKIFASFPHWNDFITIFAILFGIALICQFIVEFILLIIECWIQITLKIYLILASIICSLIGILTYSESEDYWYNGEIKESVIIFFTFYSYSICNSIVYNYLYFSKLEKETNSPVIPTKEGTEFKIDDK